MNKPSVKIVLTGLMTALVFLATSVIKIPSTNGYIHLGDGFIFLSVLVLGPFYGAFASGIGSMLADLLSPYAQWAFPTLIVKSLMALVMGIIVKQKTKKQILLSAGMTLVAWVTFFAAVKNTLTHTINLSVDNLAGTMEESPETVVQMASQIQWKLTAAIFVFLMMVFLLIFWFIKKQKITGFRPGIILGMMSSGSCMIIGYYLSEFILYGNAVSPVFSVPMNLVQFITGIMITVLVAPVIMKTRPFAKDS